MSKNGSPILAAIGVKTVAIDHQTTPKPSTSFPPTLSAHIPPTIYAMKNVKKLLARGEKYKCPGVTLVRHTHALRRKMSAGIM